MLRTAFVALILIPGLAAALFSRFAALLLYVWFAMFRPQEWLWIDVSDLRLSFVIGALLVVPCVATGIFPLVFSSFGLGSALLLALASVAQLGAVRPDLGWEWLGYLGRTGLISLMIAPLATTRERILLFVAVLSGSFLFHAMKAGLWSLLHGGVHYFNGFAGVFSDNNGFAVGTAMAMFLLLAVAQNVRHRAGRLALMVGAGPLSAMAIISLFSRGGFLALVSGLSVFVVLQKRLRYVVLSLVVIAGLAVTLPYPTGYDHRLSFVADPQTITRDASSAGRLHFWRVAVDMAEMRPFGVGLRNFEQSYDFFDSSDGFYGRGRSVHNSFFQMLAETGFAGFGVYLFLLAWTFRSLFRIRKRGSDQALSSGDRHFYFTLANGMLASMVAFVVGGSTLSLALNDMTWLTMGLVVALDRLPRLNAAERSPQPAQIFRRTAWLASST
jgi:probable O-glycosylation ligase (exosortase A-associated)